MYLLLLTIHSYLRWILVFLSIMVIGRAFTGWFRKKQWTATDRRLGLIFTIGVDLQLLIGLILYIFLSPTTKAAFQNFGGAMSDPVMRYWTVEHIVLMVVAVVLMHVGQVLAKRAKDDTAKHQRVAIFFGLAILMILLNIPWPFLPYGRPLFRLG